MKKCNIHQLRRILPVLLTLALALPSSVSAHLVKSVSLSLNDTSVAACQMVKAYVSFCIQVEAIDIIQVNGQPTGRAQVPIRVVYDEWGEDSDYEGAQGDVAKVCEKTFTVNFLPENVGADICRDFQYICQFHASTYDGTVTDPDFYACAKSTHNGAENKYSGEVEVEISNVAGSQPATASLIPPGGPSTVAVTAAADIPRVAAASLTVSFDPRTTQVLSIAPHPAFEATELEPGKWTLNLVSDEPVAFPAYLPLVSFLAKVDENLLYGDQRLRHGVGIFLTDVDFSGVDGDPIDTTKLLSFGYDQDGDGLPVPLEGEIDGDGVHDDFDAFPLNPNEVEDKDGDALGDAFETNFWGGLSANADGDDDLDGLSNLDEFVRNTNPLKSDTDEDGVIDGEDAFPTNPAFFADQDGDLVADPLDVFPNLVGAAFDDDGNGLGDSWEIHWFGTLNVDPNGDPDQDGISNLQEFQDNTNPLGLPDVLPGDLLDALRVNEEGPVKSSNVVLSAYSSTFSIDFGYAEEADLSSLQASWNGYDLLGPDGRRQTGDEPFPQAAFDVATENFEIRFTGLPLQPTGNTLQVRVTSALDPTQVDTETLHFFQTSTCTYSEKDILGGLNGYCMDNDDGTAHLYYENFDGVEVFSADWPGGISNPPAISCDKLCIAGALQVAYSTNLLNVLHEGSDEAASTWDFQTPEDLWKAPGGGCPLITNGDEEYEKCNGGGGFRCFLACGKGCVGCQVTGGADCGTADNPCVEKQFDCYKRPCCVTHDRCLAAATTPAQELACHAQAVVDGCDMADAKGQSYHLQDASCFNAGKVCVKVPAPGTPTQACCFEKGPSGASCQDLSSTDCYSAGGIPKGPGTRCTGEDGLPNSGDEPCR